MFDTFCDDRASSSASVDVSCMLTQTGIIVPTCNAGPQWALLSESLSRQGVLPDQILIVDSSSSDQTRTLARKAGYRVVQIARADFRHGATREMASKLLPGASFLVYLTQDAVPEGDDAIAGLVAVFGDPAVGAAYGRQLPRRAAGAIERHARLFSYPETSDVRTLDSRERLGFKAAFFSNAFAAFRKSALTEVGGFPQGAIVSEEVTVAARMLLAGWKTVYQAEARVFHSHHLTIRQESARYFDIGVHHGREQWLLDAFGGAGGEGRAFVASQMRYLLKHQPSQIPVGLLRNLSKLCSYQLGRRESHVPFALKMLLSGQKQFWKQEQIELQQTGLTRGRSQLADLLER